jgi:hypothetical protein
MKIFCPVIDFAFSDNKKDMVSATELMLVACFKLVL